MLQRNERIRPQIKTVDAVEGLMPTGASHCKLLELLKHMEKFDSVTEKLQCDSVDLPDIRLLFNSVVNDYHCMRDQIKPTTKIIHSPVFESAVVKAISAGVLFGAEQAVIKRFEAQKRGAKRKEREEDYATHILRDP
ncbi:Hydroxyacylglutathione hydrolase [Phytophthora cinnamomi]|uniref:Hydroxyacylglutathione hydrolase n=1 Tax=Phytophthora cinnamomi TaxID=4785 RepID=UPI00355A1324|nr:Hydroxyacylglutathione hydrolase [Phytophthora cinnamomi]